MKSILLIVILIFFTLDFAVPQTKVSLTNEYRLIESVKIGNKNNTDTDYILIKPKHVVSNSKGLIGIADEALLNVRVYDERGRFSYMFGGRGQGPTEFQHITTMNTNSLNQWIIVDYISAKIVVFDEKGQFISNHHFPTNLVQWPRRLYGMPDSGYVFLAKNINNDYIFHYFDKKLSYIKSFGKLPIIDKKNTKFESKFAEIYPGEIVVDSAGKIYYVPGLYNGRIYIYENYKLKSILQSKRKFIKTYEYESLEYLPSGPPPAKFQYSIFGPDSKYFARRNYIPCGINVFKDGSIILLTSRLHGKSNEIGVDIFTSDSPKSSYQMLLDDSLPNYNWMASNGKWYLINLVEIPYVQEFQITPKLNNRK